MGNRKGGNTHSKCWRAGGGQRYRLSVADPVMNHELTRRKRKTEIARRVFNHHHHHPPSLAHTGIDYARKQKKKDCTIARALVRKRGEALEVFWETYKRSWTYHLPVWHIPKKLSVQKKLLVQKKQKGNYLCCLRNEGSPCTSKRREGAAAVP